MATRSSRRIAAAQASAQVQQWINEGDDEEEEISSDDEFGVDSETEDVVEYQSSVPDTASCSSSEEESESIVPCEQSVASSVCCLGTIQLHIPDFPVHFPYLQMQNDCSVKF